ncbi:MAG: LuxR C-terminal-related transcriptional regulator [Saonia sp.]
MTCIAVLPILTVIGDYQWLTFTVMNIAFYAVTAMEIDRYLYLLEHKSKLVEVLEFYKDNKETYLNPKFLNKGLTRREIEISLSILDNYSYKEIGEDFCIAESTVSKHASNIFKKTNVSSRTEFLSRFGTRGS